MFLRPSRKCCPSCYLPALETLDVLLVKPFLIEREGVHPINSGLFVDSGGVLISGKECVVVGIRSAKTGCAQVRHSAFVHRMRRLYEVKILTKFVLIRTVSSQSLTKTDAWRKGMQLPVYAYKLPMGQKSLTFSPTAISVCAFWGYALIQ